MNKPFSFRSDLNQDLSSGPERINVASRPRKMKIRWHQSVEFFPPCDARDFSSQPTAFSTNKMLCSLFPNELDRPVRKPGFARWLTTLGAIGLGLALFPSGAAAQSLWHDEVSKPMYADKRATGVGDVLTILVSESTSSTKDNKTSTAKESGLDASLSSFLFSPTASGLLTKGGQLPAMKFDSKSDFTGGGSINNSEKLSARAAVQVKDVLPNRNLVIEGRRETSVGGEQQTMVLRGIVRPEDVLANNTVYSYNVADATIQIISKGTISDGQRKGWFHKIWDKVSPF